MRVRSGMRWNSDPSGSLSPLLGEPTRLEKNFGYEAKKGGGLSRIRKGKRGNEGESDPLGIQLNE